MLRRGEKALEEGEKKEEVGGWVFRIDKNGDERRKRRRRRVGGWGGGD